MNVRRMRPHELDAAVSVWREANVARGVPHGSERTARVRAKLSASDALAFVALRPGIVGMALAHVLEVAGSLGYQRVGVWTAKDNTPARELLNDANRSKTRRLR